MKLSKLVIKNFQSHKKSVLNLVDGINVIVGESDQGKTAILRAFEMLRTNRPLGAKFYRNSAPSTGTMSVKAVFDDGLQVLLKRKVKKSDKKKTVVSGSPEYKIKGPETDWKSLKGFKSSVPNEVQEALNLGEINIHNQLDSSFLVSDGGAKLAKFINDLIDAESIDKWQSEANKRLRTAKTREKVAAEELDTINQDLKRLQILDLIETDADILQRVTSDLEKITDQYEELQQALEDYQHAGDRLERISPLLSKFDSQIAKIKSEYDDLRTTGQHTITAISKLEEYVRIESEIKIIESKVVVLEADYKTILQRSGRCPYCNSKIKKD